ncbi:MAG: metal-dependent transcriptional regulator [Armatimonadota bacterium]
MNKPNLTESAEEALAGLWLKDESREDRGAAEPECRISDLGAQYGDAAVAELIESGLVEERAGALTMTQPGRAEAASIIRRERLAERLLTDILELGESQVEETACKFEHLLRRGIDDGICTLLGHPRFCPHGSPIPAGECCRAGASSAERVISSLADLVPGQVGTVAYIHGRRRELMQRMLAMGVVPGAPIRLAQTTPSYVFELGQAQLAVDRETAQDIYVRLAARSRSRRQTAAPGWLPKPIRGLGLRRRRGRR